MLVELFIAKVIADSFTSKKKPVKKFLKAEKRDNTYAEKRYNALRKAKNAEIADEANRLLCKSKGLL